VSLTSSVLVWLAWIAAVALFCRIVFWPRPIRSGWLGVLGRAGYQLTVVVTVLLAVGLMLNDQYGWYANWGDLGSVFAADARGDVVAAGAAASLAAGDAAGSNQTTGTAHQAVPLSTVSDLTALGLSARVGPAAGQVRSYPIPGTVSGVTSTVSVWFPPQYTDPAFGAHRFPVLEAFHGIPGSPRQLFDNMSLGKDVAQQTAAGNLAPSVIVMPSYAPHQLDTECVDGGAGHLQMEQWITADVTAWVERHLRVANDRTSWATFGLSAGAWCASMLAMLHPDIYSAAISLGGYYQPTFEAPYIPFTPNSTQWQRYDLLKLARTEPPRMALWVQTSKADAISYGTARQLLATAKPPLSVTADVLPNAGHRLSVWIHLIPETLRWLGATAPGFRPTQTIHLPSGAAPQHSLALPHVGLLPIKVSTPGP